MRLPSMRYSDGIGKVQQIKFGGLNRNPGASDGEIYDMRNLSGAEYPLLSTRKRRYKVHTLANPSGIYARERLCWVDGTDFYYNYEKKGTVSEGDKTFGSLGSYIIILPDKCFYNVDTDVFGSLEAKWSGQSVKFQDGTIYGQPAKANTIECAGVDWAQYFKPGDAVSISGCTAVPGNNKHIIIREIDGSKLRFYEHSFSLKDDAAYTEPGTVTIHRSVPDMDFICENENRLWGCKGDRIYACALGDVFNWNVFDGLDTGSYTTPVGSEGDFTGCISYQGYPMFFKERHVYKVYGNMPTNYQVMGSASLGVKSGCAKSLAIAGEALFYLSNNGVVAYTGGIPQPVGECFGDLLFTSGVAGSDGLRYYISLLVTYSGHGWRLYCYDTQRGLWHCENDKHFTHFANDGHRLLGLTRDGEIWVLNRTPDRPWNPDGGVEMEGDVEWFAEFGDFTEENPNKKGISKLQLRFELEEDAVLQVFMMFDSDGVWHKISEIAGGGQKRSCYLPIVPRRADHYRLKLAGVNGCRIYSLTRELYIGSELKSIAGRK